MNDKYKKLAERIGVLVDEKNQAYGNSFLESAQFLKLLYPNGISPERYGDMLCVVRIWDKIKRIATKKGAFNESPYVDIVGYGLLGTMKDEEEQRQMEAKNQKLLMDDLLNQLKNSNVVCNGGIFGRPEYLILKIMEEGNSVRLAPLKKDRPQQPYIAEELSEVVETNIVEMGLKELLEGLTQPMTGWQIVSEPSPLIFGECNFCKSLLEDGVPVKNVINGDKFSHQGCFEDHLKSLNKTNNENTENGNIEHQKEGEVVGAGIDVGDEDHSRILPKPNMVKPFKNKKKHVNIKKKGCFIRHGK